MASTNTTPESKNKSWGYYGTISHHGDAAIAWPIAINTISDATQLTAETVATVLADGYSWEGRPYKSLSAIARAITGTRWNGWTFFGIPNRRGAA
jgi:hypothetical protein